MKELLVRESLESLMSRKASCEEIAAHGWIRTRKEFKNPCTCDYCEGRRKKRDDFAALLGRKPYVSKTEEK